MDSRTSQCSQLLRLSNILVLFFFSSSHSWSMDIDHATAMAVQQCLVSNNSNAIVPTEQGEQGWGSVPEGWLSYDSYDETVVDIYYFGNPDYSHSWFTSESDIRAVLERRYDYPVDWFAGEAPAIRTGKDHIRGVVLNPTKLSWVGYNYDNCSHLSHCPQVYSNNKQHPSDEVCRLAFLDGILVGHYKDPDCSKDFIQGYKLKALLRKCGILSLPSSTDGNPSCVATSLAIGNPINLSSGNKYQSELVFSGNVSLSFNYNSSTGMWRHSQAYSLDITDTEILLIRPDGKGLTFTQQGSQWQSDGDVFYALSEYDDGAGSAWKVVTPSGNTELYDTEGRILTVMTLQGKRTSFRYSDNISTITGPQGNTLVLDGNAEGVLYAATLNGEVTATFEYDDQQRLIARATPDGNRTQYHYENTDFPKHLTGITGPDGQRFATWAYDNEGRGILSEHAGQERAELVFNADGSTTVTNALGKQTTYHFTEIEGLKRVTRVEGHATEHCVGANKAYSYYDSGLLKTKTDWRGNTTRYEYNPRGLITRTVEADGTAQVRTIEQSWHPSLPLLEQRTDDAQTTHFSYGTNYRLQAVMVQAHNL